jgi:SPP1 family holin
MDKASIGRFTLLVIAAVNAVLNLLGYQTISDEFANDIVAVISGAIFIWAAWKNNYLAKKGRKQKESLERIGLK